MFLMVRSWSRGFLTPCPASLVSEDTTLFSIFLPNLIEISLPRLSVGSLTLRCDLGTLESLLRPVAQRSGASLICICGFYTKITAFRNRLGSWLYKPEDWSSSPQDLCKTWAWQQNVPSLLCHEGRDSGSWGLAGQLAMLKWIHLQ